MIVTGALTPPPRSGRPAVSTWTIGGRSAIVVLCLARSSLTKAARRSAVR